VIAAAFIGPGTVTTAAQAGAGFGLALLWALVFSTVATLVLQEAAARLTVVSGESLGRALRGDSHGGAAGVLVLLVVLGAVVLGCAAYEAGTILGGVAGAALAIPLPRGVLTLGCGVLAAGVLALGTPRQVARLLSLLVAVMGAAFLVTAASLAPDLGELLRGAFVPATPAGSGLLILGLVGTTVVPYNLFLGSGLAAGERLEELRFGLTVAVVLGGVISMGVLVVGSAVAGDFTFEALSEVLASRLGGWARGLFAAGLFAAGLSSAITAPLAAAITARSVFAREESPAVAEDPRWGAHSWRFRSVWGSVVAAGVVFGVTDVQPIPAIVLAQALNGVLLPLVAVYLALVVNDRRRMGEGGLNGLFANTVLAAVVAVTVLLGVTNLVRAGARVLDRPAPEEGLLLAVAAAITVLLAVPLVRAAARRRRPPSL
jgi:manganese transport protein